MNDQSGMSTPPIHPGQVPSRPESPPRDPQVVQIIRMPDALKANPPQNALDGLIIARDTQQHRVTIRTTQGDIELQLPAGRELPPRGAEVKIQLPQNQNASQTNTARPAQPANMSYTPPQQPAAAPPTATAPPAPRPDQYQPPIASAPPQLPPQTGQIVRLTPLPPAQLPQLQLPPIQQPLPVPLPAVLPQVVLQPQLSTHLQTAALQLTASSLPPIPQPALTPPTLTAPALQLTPPATQTPIITVQPVLPAIVAQLPAPALLAMNFTAPAPVTPLSPQQPDLQIASAQLQTGTFTPLKAGALPPLLSLPDGMEPPQLMTTAHALPKFTIPGKIDLPVLNIQPPPVVINPLGQTAPLIAPAPVTLQISQIQPSTISATVIGATPQGQPVIALQPPGQNAPFFFVLQISQSLPVGTQITFPASALPAAAPTPSGGSSSPLPTLLPSLFTPGPWPAAEEMVELLRQASPQLAQNVLQIMPNPSQPQARFGAAMLFVLTIMKGGDLTSWIGEKSVDTLRRMGKSDLIQRLGGDLATLGRASGEPVGNDWRGMAIPLAWQDEVFRMAVFYKRDQDAVETAEKGPRPTRFIFDLKLERMGAVQIDGLFKPYGKSLRLDLVVRTEAALSPAMRQKMRLNFAAVMELSNLTGELAFQGQTEDFVKILKSEQSLGLST